MKLNVLSALLVIFPLSLTTGGLSQTQLLPAPVTPSRLVEVGNEEETGPIMFDMGVLDQMDETQWNEDFKAEHKLFPWQPGYHRILRGSKHIFQLKNNGEKDIDIDRIEGTSLYVEVEFVDDGIKRGWPYVLKPGETVGVRVAFNFYSSSPGPMRKEINLFKVGATQPLATLIVQGNVKGGINFLENAVDFGKGKLGEKSREFTLTFNKKVPLRMIAQTLKLVCSNPDIMIQSLDEGKVIMGVEVAKDQMTFPMDTPFPEELRLRFRATLSNKASMGPITGRISLIMLGRPLAVIVRDVSIPLTGEITKRP